MSNRPPQFPQQPGPPAPYAQYPGPPPNGGGNKTLFIILGIVGGVLVLTMCTCGGCIWWGVSSTRTAFNEAIEEAEARSKAASKSRDELLEKAQAERRDAAKSTGIEAGKETRIGKDTAAGRNHLRAIGLAMHRYHDLNKAFPLASFEDESGKEQSWRTAISKNMFRNLADTGSPTDTSYLAVVDENTAISKPGEKPKSFRDILDGSSNTAIVIEVHNTKQPWNTPGDITIDEAIRIIQNSPTGSTNCLFVDGKTIAISKNASSETLRNLFTINDRNVIEFSDLTK